MAIKSKTLTNVIRLHPRRARLDIVLKLSFVPTLTLFLFGGAAFAQLTDSGIYSPPNYYTLPAPDAGSSYFDPVFGTTIRRISNAAVEPNMANPPWTLPFISNEYSTISPFNSNNSWILGLHASYFALYDGSGKFIKTLDVCASCEPRWSRVYPNFLYFIKANQLLRLDVSTDEALVSHTFSEYASISGKGESDLSADGNHFVFAGDNRSVFVYAISNDKKGPVFDAGSNSFDSLYITPNNNVVISYYQVGTARYNGIELFDPNMNFLRQVARAVGHMDVTSDTNGDEILLWANAADPTPICINAIVKIRLSDANQTCLISLDWSLAFHVSATDSGGGFFMETYAPSDPSPDSTDWKAYTNEILQVKLDGTEIRRLTHHRSRPFTTYNYSPRPSASRDGSRIIFNSNFGLYGPSTVYTDVYLMVLSESSLTRVVRYDQTDMAITYTGEWATNNLSTHAGGSAAVTMDSGSSVTFTFVGTGIRWIGYRDKWSGVARVYLDNVLIDTIDTFASQAAAQTVLYSLLGLASASHTLVLEVTGERNPNAQGAWVWVDALDVHVKSTSDGIDKVINPGIGTTASHFFSGQELAPGIAYMFRHRADVFGLRCTFLDKTLLPASVVLQ